MWKCINYDKKNCDKMWEIFENLNFPWPTVTEIPILSDPGAAPQRRGPSGEVECLASRTRLFTYLPLSQTPLSAVPRKCMECTGLDKIKTFHDRSLNFSKLSMKVRKLWQENLRQKVRNLWNQESLNQIYFVFGNEILIIIRIIPIIVRWLVIIYFFVTDTVFPSKSKHKP